MRVLVLMIALLWALPAAAQDTRSAAPHAAPPPARLADLAWLEGSWVGDGLGGQAREVYSPPIGGQIVGHFIQVGADGIRFSEILSIAQVNGSLEYRLQHFDADLTGWEDKDEVVRFPLVAVEDDAWYFDGLTIRREGPDGLITAVRIDDAGGARRDAVFRYRRER